MRASSRSSMLELGSLIRRDHDDLHETLRILGDATAGAETAALLDRVRTRFAVHAEAETMALGAMLEHAHAPPSLYFMVSQVVASHLAQESALARLVEQHHGTPAFRERARQLRHLMVHHAEHEAACLHPALPDHLPREVYRALGTGYAIERSRLLAAHPVRAPARAHPG